MSPRITTDQLEQMKTHELADLLTNVVLLLRRLPNVEWQQLLAPLPAVEPATEAPLPVSGHRQPTLSTEPEHSTETPKAVPALSATQLKKMTVPELHKLARELALPVASKIKKDDLIQKLLARINNSHSDQFAIQEI
ncbi:MAG TPA: Rho termination factor N-terminal domain-containing protein [Ktedonobacteraceae bacterium]|nr:Rho termination factor N-terminal domain-containing protein [Ktedonobacteraceae bacterium]